MRLYDHKTTTHDPDANVLVPQDTTLETVLYFAFNTIILGLGVALNHASAPAAGRAQPARTYAMTPPEDRAIRFATRGRRAGFSRAARASQSRRPRSSCAQEASGAASTLSGTPTTDPGTGPGCSPSRWARIAASIAACPLPRRSAASP